MTPQSVSVDCLNRSTTCGFNGNEKAMTIQSMKFSLLRVFVRIVALLVAGVFPVIPQFVQGQAASILAPGGYVNACAVEEGFSNCMFQATGSPAFLGEPGPHGLNISNSAPPPRFFNGGNSGAANAAPFSDKADVSAMSVGAGSAGAEIWLVVDLIDKKTGLPVSGPCEVRLPCTMSMTIAATGATSGPLSHNSEALWNIQIGRAPCDTLVGDAIFDPDTNIVIAIDKSASAQGCGMGSPFPTYAEVSGGSSREAGFGISDGSGAVTFKLLPDGSREIDTLQNFSSATFLAPVSFEVPDSSFIVHESAFAGGDSLTAVDPQFTPANPDVVAVVRGPLNPNPTASPLAGFDLSPLQALNIDLSGFQAAGFLSTSTTPLPITSAVPSPGPNSDGWNNTNVTVALSATDAGGPGVQSITFALVGAQTAGATVAGANAVVTISAEGITTLTYFAQDRTGRQEAPKRLTVQIDKTPPTLGATLTPLPNGNGWNNTNVTAQFTATDALSGVAIVSSPVTLTSEGKGQVVMGTATDRAGNTASLNVTVNIDKTPPVISGLPAAGCTLWPPNHQLVQVANVSATDALSGVAPGSFLVTGASNEATNAGGSGSTAPDILIDGGNVEVRAERSGSGNGRVYTVDATATDLAGNVAIASGDCVVSHDQ